MGWLAAVLSLMMVAGCASPGPYEAALHAGVVGEAPFEVSGDSALVDGESDSAPLVLTITSDEHLLLEDQRWTHITTDAQGTQVAAVFGEGCHLFEAEAGMDAGCNDMYRLLTVRPGQPLRDEVTVRLLAPDHREPPAEWMQTIRWWELAPDTDPVDAFDEASDGQVDVLLRLTFSQQDRR